MDSVHLAHVLCLGAIVLGLSASIPSCKRESPAPTATSTATAPASSASTAPPKPPPAPSSASAERTIAFAFRPTGASTREYAISDPMDQHHALLLRGVERGRACPVVVALHGQPRRGQAPRDYRFPKTVAQVAREMVSSGELEPFVLVTPVFRFEGQNWPHFELGPFMAEVKRVLADAGVTPDGLYVFGHSGAAGCGGAGLNHAASAKPDAVGFFDTCVGASFGQAIAALAKARVPTLILHSVETAGFVPRQPVEYAADFDFGKVYAPLGLKMATCPEQLPDAPLRSLDYRCAKSDSGLTQALVVDTGRGEPAHEALVPVAMRYFLRRYLKGRSARP